MFTKEHDSKLILAEMVITVCNNNNNNNKVTARFEKFGNKLAIDVRRMFVFNNDNFYELIKALAEIFRGFD